MIVGILFTFGVPAIISSVQYGGSVFSYTPILVMFGIVPIIVLTAAINSLKKSNQMRQEIKSGKYTKTTIETLIDTETETFELDDFVIDDTESENVVNSSSDSDSCNNSCLEEGDDIFAQTREKNKEATRTAAKNRTHKPGKRYCKHCGLEMLYDDDKCEWCGEEQ